MTGQILFFPATPSQFTPRVEVHENVDKRGEPYWSVEAFDHNGRHVVETLKDPDEAEAFADGFRLRYREIFANDLARRRAAKSNRAPTPWWVDPDQGGAA